MFLSCSALALPVPQRDFYCCNSFIRDRYDFDMRACHAAPDDQQGAKRISMTHPNCAIDDSAVPANGGSDRRCCGLRLLSPPDALTRMLMKADGVTESYLDALVGSVAKARAKEAALFDPLVTTTAP
jgi:hypothetical protein